MLTALQAEAVLDAHGMLMIAMMDRGVSPAEARTLANACLPSIVLLAADWQPAPDHDPELRTLLH